MAAQDQGTQPRKRLNTIGTFRRDLAALLGFVALIALFYAPVLLGRHTFSAGDFTDHFFPFSLFLRSELLAGRLPLWNPFTYGGHPFLADIQAGVFYPINLLFLAISAPFGSDAARLYFLQIEALVQIVLAGFFTYLLVNALTGRRLASFLAGGVFALSGYMTGYPVLQLAILRVAMWLPLVLWMLLHAFGQPRRWRWWIAAALVYAVAFLAGHPQTFLHVSYAILAWIALLAFRELRNRPPELAPAAYLLRIGVFYLLCAGLIAAQLLPSLEFMRLSVRASADYAFVSGGFPLADTWQVLLPYLVSPYSPLFVGIAALGLVALAIVQAVAAPASASRGPAVRSAGEFRLFVAFFVLLALVAWLVSYGRNAFLYPVFYRLLPGWNLFQGQERAAYLVAFGLSILAGYGGAALVAVSSRQRRLTALVYAALVLIGIAAFLLRYRQAAWTGASPAQVQQGALAALGVVVLFVVLLWPDGLARWRLALVTVLVLAELLLTNRGVNSDAVSLAQQAALPAGALAVRQAVEEQGSVGFTAGSLTYGGPPGRVFNEHRIFEDYGMRAGVEDLWGSSPLRLSRTAALLEGFPQDRLWQLMGVQQVLNSLPALYQPAEMLGEFQTADGSSYLHRLTQPSPRAWVVQTVERMADDAALPLLGDARFDPAATALLPPVTDAAGHSEVAGEGLLALPGQNTVTLQQVAPGRLHIDVQSEHGGLLVISENWMPGWRATVRQSPDQTAAQAPVARVDVALLGVPIAAGQSIIDLEYRPESVGYGIAISIATLILLALAFALVRLRRGKGEAVRAGRQTSEFAWKTPGPQWIMGVVVLAAFALRMFHLGNQELRGDEAFGYFFSLNSLSEIVRSTIALREPHPVASYFLQHVWLALAGHSEVALRFSNVWFGVLAVALLYRLGRRLGLGAATAALAAALMAASPYAIWHSQDARMYAISLALTTASTWLALEVVHRRRPRWLVAYVLVTWLALQTHYFAVFIVVAQNLFVFGVALVDKEMRRSLGRWILAQVGVGLLYLPWLIVAADTLTGYRGNGDSPAFAAMLQRALSVFAVGESTPMDQRVIFAALAAVLLLVGAARLARAGPQARRALALLALYLAVPLLATWISALGRPVFNERYLIAAAPPFFLLIAAAVLGVRELAAPTDDQAIGNAPRRAARVDRSLGWAATAILVLVAAGALASLARAYEDPTYSKTIGWRQLAGALDRYSASLPNGDVRVAQNYPDPSLWYYYRGPVDHLVLPPAGNDSTAAALEVAGLADRGVQRIVIALQPSDGWDNSGIAEQALGQRYSLLATAQVAGWPVQVYARPPDTLQPLDETFAHPDGGAVRLTGLAIPAQTLLPGDVLDIHLRWDGTDEALDGSEKLTLQLLDAAGRLVAQSDQPLAASDLGAPATTYALSIPWQLPPGEYRLIAALYDPAVPGAPRLLTASGADHVDLAVLRSN
ncbi:MAG: glycosyltransferase family 39 protein [Caldilineales bacterium]